MGEYREDVQSMGCHVSPKIDARVFLDIFDLRFQGNIVAGFGKDARETPRWK
jgi:hypothetical protein